jgi:CHAT domain-containing protein/Tfp pilus assembly protein PilF
MLSNLGAAYQALSQYTQAITYFEQALVIARVVGNRAREGLALNNLGVTYQALSRYEQAIAYSEQAREIFHEVGRQADEGTALNNLGVAHQALSQYEQALTYHEQALAIARAVGNRAGEAALLNNLGQAYQELSQYEQAIAYFEQALAVARQVQDRAQEGGALNSLGRASKALSRYERALAYYEQSHTIAHEVGRRAEEGIVLNNLGDVAHALSQYGQALTYLEQALAITREVGNRDREGLALNNMGTIYLELRQDEQAIAYLKQALTPMRVVENRQGEALVLNNLGLAYEHLGQHAQASAALEQALVIHRDVGDRIGEAAVLNNLGTRWVEQGQYEQAIPYLEQALAILREVGNRAGEAYILHNLGMASAERHQYPQALAYYEQALALAHQVGARAVEAHVLTRLMRLWQDRQRPRLAIFYGKQAVNVLQSLRGEVQTLAKALQRRFLTAKADAYRTLADLLITAGRLPEAQQVLNLLKDDEYFAFVRRDAQTASSLQGRATLTPEEAEWAQRYQEIADRVTALGRAREALQAKASRSEAEAQRLAALEDELRLAVQALQQCLADVTTAFSGAAPGHEPLPALLRKTEELMSDLADLGPGTVVLYTVVTEERYRVIVITSETQVVRDAPITAAALNCKMHAFREVLGTLQVGDRTPAHDPRPLAQELYQILVAPVARDLDGAQAQTLVWVLDGALRYLPVAALHDGERYLLERYRQVVMTPASRSRLKDLPRSTWTALGLGVSKAHGKFPALPAVPTELRGIIRTGAPATDGVLPGVIQLDEAFTAQSMLAALQQHYPVVHIASHFEFHPGNEAESFLLLGDGSRLSLAQLHEQWNLFRGVDLLTLSACDTAMGSFGATGTEVEGFAVLAQRKGAKAVVASRWPVADRSTQALMQTFYRLRERQPGLPKVVALRQAQLALLHGPGMQAPGLQVAARSAPLGVDEAASEATGERTLWVATASQAPGACGDGTRPPPYRPSAQAPYAHPYYWAPFILIGNWQ